MDYNKTLLSLILLFFFPNFTSKIRDILFLTSKVQCTKLIIQLQARKHWVTRRLMKDFYENAVLQLLFQKSANLINLWKCSVIFLKNYLLEIHLPRIIWKIRRFHFSLYRKVWVSLMFLVSEIIVTQFNLISMFFVSFRYNSLQIR